MAYFADGTALHYHSGAYDAGEWRCPAIAIGWLEHPHSYETGTCTSDVLFKIVQLRRHFRDEFPGAAFRGFHHCSICVGDVTEAHLDESHINLFIPADDVLFVAPGRVDHYIEAHGYVPPAKFLDALARCPFPNSPAYRIQLTALNLGKRPPLFEGEWAVFRIDSEGNRFLMLRFDTKDEAQRMAEHCAKHDRKQTYRVEYSP